MFAPKSKIASSLIIVFLAVATVPVLAVDYNPGVSKGHYAKYGNFVGIGPGVEVFNDYDWQRVDVVDVSGKAVTLLSTGQFKNGVATPGNGTVEVWNVEAGTRNGTLSVQGSIIAANLNEGDAIPPPNTYAINKTETRTYLGVSRSVNMLNVTISTPDYETTLTFIYDKASGMLLESSSRTTPTIAESTPSEYSYGVVETNIFGISPTIGVPVEYILIAVIVFLVIIIFVVVALLLRKRAK